MKKPWSKTKAFGTEFMSTKSEKFAAKFRVVILIWIITNFCLISLMHSNSLRGAAEFPLDFIMTAVALVYILKFVFQGKYFFDNRFWIPLVGLILVEIVVILYIFFLYQDLRAGNLRGKWQGSFFELQYWSFIFYAASFWISKARKHRLLIVYSIAILALGILFALAIDYKWKLVYQVVIYVCCLVPLILLYHVQSKTERTEIDENLLDT